MVYKLDRTLLLISKQTNNEIFFSASKANGIFLTRLYEDIFCYGLAVKHPDNPVAIACIMLAVRNHNDSSSLFIQLYEQLHYFISV